MNSGEVGSGIPTGSFNRNSEAQCFVLSFLSGFFGALMTSGWLFSVVTFVPQGINVVIFVLND